MEIKDFEIEIGRLKKTYGVAKYPDERIYLMYEKLCGLPYDAFKNQVSAFIAEREKAPMLSDFFAAFSGQMDELRRQEIERRLTGVPDCLNCAGEGAVVFYKRSTGNGYAFQCTCPRGPLIYPFYPKWKSEYHSEFASHREWVSGKFQMPRFYEISKKQKNYESLSKFIVPPGVAEAIKKMESNDLDF